MEYSVTKQFGSIKYLATMETTERVAGAGNVSATFVDTGTNFNVHRHDDDMLQGGGAGGHNSNIYQSGQSWVTMEQIDLRSLYSEGKVLDNIRINLQRPFNAPRIEEMYNISPDADLWETVIITTDANPSENISQIWEAHLNGYHEDRAIEGGMGKAHDIVFAQTRIYHHDQSRVYTGLKYTQHPEVMPPAERVDNGTAHYAEFILADEIVRGYPDLVYCPTLTIYRLFTSWYYARGNILADATVNDQQAKAVFYIAPMQLTLSGTVRAGTESEVIMISTDNLLARPQRPGGTRP